MSAPRARKVLFAAFAISLLLHVLLAGYVHWPSFPQARENPQFIAVRRFTIARAVPRTPRPQARARPTPARALVRSKVIPPAITPRGTSGRADAGTTIARPAQSLPLPTPQATAAPTATAEPTAAAGCSRPDAAPGLVAAPDVPIIPAQVRAAKVSGVTVVNVGLDASARVIDATIGQSSGNVGLDALAAGMARAAAYAPKYIACKPVPGTFAFIVRFAAW